MSIRISCASTEGVATLRVEGRLLSDDLVSFQAECDRQPGAFRLDLSELQFADRESAEALRRLLRERAELVGASPYLELLLRPKPPADDGPTPADDEERTGR